MMIKYYLCYQLAEVLSNIFPKYTSNMINNYFNNNTQTATKMQIEAIKLINLLFKEVNPIPVKAALNIMGFNFGKPRMPLIECSEKLKNELKEILN